MFSQVFAIVPPPLPPPYSSYTFTNIYHDDAVNEILQNEITGTQTSFFHQHWR